MARTTAANEARARYKAVHLELAPQRAEKWTAYATAHGLTLGRMITACVERCIAEDSRMQGLIDSWTEDGTATVAPDVAPDIAPDQPTANDV